MARPAPAGIRLHADGPARRLRGLRARAARRPGRGDGPRPRRRAEGCRPRDPETTPRPLHQLLRALRHGGARPVAWPGARHPGLPQALTPVAVSDSIEPSLQRRYAPATRCFGCGPANDRGLRLESRIAESADGVHPGELVATW